MLSRSSAPSHPRTGDASLRLSMTISKRISNLQSTIYNLQLFAQRIHLISPHEDQPIAKRGRRDHTAAELNARELLAATSIQRIEHAVGGAEQQLTIGQ